MTATETLIGKTLKAWRFLYRRGFIEGFGHISARLPDSDRFLIVRHSLGPRATAEDLIVMDFTGRKVDLMGREIDSDIVERNRGDPEGCLADYLREGRTNTARELAKKAAIGLYPQSIFEKIIWQFAN